MVKIVQQCTEIGEFNKDPYNNYFYIPFCEFKYYFENDLPKKYLRNLQKQYDDYEYIKLYYFEKYKSETYYDLHWKYYYDEFNTELGIKRCSLNGVHQYISTSSKLAYKINKWNEFTYEIDRDK